MGLKTKIKLILGACCVILAVTCFVAFNSFGIDADTIYKLQGEMDTTMYNRARGYMYSGNEVFGLFSEEEEGVTDVPDVGEGEVYTDAPVDGGDGQTYNPQSWLDMCDMIHKAWGAAGFTYAQGGTQSFNYNGNTFTVRTDCSGYVGFCMYAMGWADSPINIISSSDLTPYGFTAVSVDSLQSGDVLAYDGHIEVYVGSDMVVYNWGGSKSAENKYKGVTDVSTVVSTSNSSKTVAEITKVWRPPATVSTPSSNSGQGKVVFVDAGHGCNYTNENKYSDRSEGWATEGAAGEADWAQGMANLLVAELEARGYTVLTLDDAVASTPTGETPRQYYGNKGRSKLFDSSDASILIQMHYDGAEDASITGAHAIYTHSDEANKRLAACLINNWEQNTGLTIKGEFQSTGGTSYRPELGIGKGSSKPVCLMECGFGAPGKADYESLRNPDIQAKIVKSMVDGIDLYFNGG